MAFRENIEMAGPQVVLRTGCMSHAGFTMPS